MDVMSYNEDITEDINGKFDFKTFNYTEQISRNLKEVQDRLLETNLESTFQHEVSRLLEDLCEIYYSDNKSCQQRNQNNNNDGGARSSNTSLRNLTSAIHNSDQVKDILFSSGTKDKPPPRSSNINSLLNKPEIQNEFISEHEKPIERHVMPRDNGSNRNSKQAKKIAFSRKKHYSSSSSSSSTESSCSCSKKRRKRHNNKCQNQCQSRISCQHQCCGQSCAGKMMNSAINPESFNNFNQCNSAYPDVLQPYNNYPISQQPWPNMYNNQFDMNSMMVYPYDQRMYYPEPNYITDVDMSGIIERMHKLDVSISHLTERDNTCHCNSPNISNRRTDALTSNYFASY